MSLFHLLGMKILPQKLKSMPYLENLAKFNLDLCSLRYCNYPYVSCLGMNPRRRWNPNLEESYLVEYSESEAEYWIQHTSRIYLRPVKVLALETSAIPRYNEFTKTYQF